MNTYLKFGLLSAAVVGALVYVGKIKTDQTMTYFKTIPELTRMGDQAQVKRLRVTGYVQPGSVIHDGHDVKFTLVENEGGTNEGLHLAVVYNGVDSLPDTFKDHAQAVADGKLDPSGVFHANKIQAKCASKYEVAPPKNVKPAASSSI
jgi:cytochrome c-type biogenesis protein CcmE